MKFGLTGFNTYLLAALAPGHRLRWAVCWTTLAVAVCAGCKTAEQKQESALRLYLEVTPNPTTTNVLAMIGRTRPFPVYVEKEPFLYENNVASAKVSDVMGGFEIELQLDQKGTWLLEQYTTANKTRHIAVFSIFGEGRWLAAPLITRRIADGKLSFTPDATREEAERIVRGLNRVAKLVEQGRR